MKMIIRAKKSTLLIAANANYVCLCEDESKSEVKGGVTVGYRNPIWEIPQGSRGSSRHYFL
jgi:hypothetical protein